MKTDAPGPLFSRLSAVLRKGFTRVVSLLRTSEPDRGQLLWRIQLMERDIVLPIKIAGIGMVLYSFYFTPWIGNVLGALDIAVELTQSFLWLYILVNVLYALSLFALHSLPLELLEWEVFAMSLIDGIFLCSLTLVTGGYDSILYWLFLGLILRGSVSVPRATSQIMLNLTLTASYILAGVIEISVAANLRDTDRPVMELPENPTEPLVLRLVLLLLMTFCCYAIQVLFERQRQATAQGREFDQREAELRSAGRLAAEIAHQLKNPLAIINNAVFSLKRSVKEKQPDPSAQLQMIAEEVERADRIITELIGYAQLSEGRVEKVSVLEELDRALQDVFPPAAQYSIRVHRDYAAHFPPLLVQRRHVSEAFRNLLQNAREALDGHGGNVFVTARCRSDYAVEVVIADDGPGIDREKQQKIFDAYFTTKEKGTGLGLATVKHNVELYGGSVRVESELGNGARFTLTFPAKTLIKPERAF